MTPRDRVYFLPKDPHWTLVWWELSEASLERGQLVLRVTADDAPIAFDVPVTVPTDHWYLHLPASGHTYRVSLAFPGSGGELHVVAGSNPLRLPPEGPADHGEEIWSTVPIRRSRWKSKVIS